MNDLLHNEYIGELKLGASTTIAQYVLPPLLGSFIVVSGGPNSVLAQWKLPGNRSRFAGTPHRLGIGGRGFPPSQSEVHYFS